MEYVDLKLIDINQENQKNYIFTELLKESKTRIVVVLGSAGSGKTTILKKYQKNNQNSRYLSVKSFIKSNNFNKLKAKKIVLLDGLDEYRAVESDKSYVTEELGVRIYELLEEKENIEKVVITCRELDWFGDSDKNALKDGIDENVELYKIDILDYAKKLEFCNYYEVDNREDFLDTFAHYGFLENPQMFVMCLSLYKNDGFKNKINSKSDLYRYFIENVREKNKNYKNNKLNSLTKKELFEYSGYLACYYILFEIDIFDSSSIEDIVSEEFEQEKIEIVLKTNLFDNASFIHRTIAEYLCANFIYSYILKEQCEGFTFERVKNLFIKNNRVFTELRATYSWLCALSKNQKLIEIDSYYQAVYGDNSNFSLELKKLVILAVKKYSKENPHFYSFSLANSLDSFYQNELDEFLISEFEEAINLGYKYFIMDILTSENEISKKIEQYLKSLVIKSNSGISLNIIRYFSSDIEFLKNILEQIVSKEIDDEDNSLKDSILDSLYPKHITDLEIVEYLKLYNQGRDSLRFQLRFLYKAGYKSKFDLIDKIYKSEIFNNSNSDLLLTNSSFNSHIENIKKFIKNYFVETILKFENELDAEQIFEILIYFYQNYYKEEYETIDFSLYNIENIKKDNSQKFQRLANELYSLYVNYLIDEKEKYFYQEFYRYSAIFNLAEPNNKKEILLNVIEGVDSSKCREDIFYSYLYLSTKEEVQNSSRIKELAQKFDFEKQLNNYLNPPKRKKLDWEIKHENRIKEIDKNKREEIEKNILYFKNRSDKEIEQSLNDLIFISKLIYIEVESWKNHIDKSTFERLKSVLREVIYKNSFDAKYLTLKSLVESDNDLNIDLIYYVSLYLNRDVDIFDVELTKYLYINIMLRSFVINIPKTDYSELLEQKEIDFCKKTLKEYVKLKMQKYLPFLGNLYSYIEQDEDLQNLKNIAHFCKSNLSRAIDSCIEKILITYNFNLKNSDLEQIKAFYDFESKKDIPKGFNLNEQNQNVIKAILAIKKDDKSKFSIDLASDLYRYLNNSIRELDIKVKIIDFMMSIFNSEKLIEHHNGLQSNRDECATFLRGNALDILSIEELEELYKTHKSDIWTDSIKYKIEINRQKEIDRERNIFSSLEEVKSFILSSKVVTKENFFLDVYYKLLDLKQNIEDNRDNEKNAFYNQKINKAENPKVENSCRDIVMQRLKDRYLDLEITKEKEEADNRVDLNIKHKDNLEFEVQIECKRDDNKNIYAGVKEQLIDKYLNSKVEYGIYLVFYFGAKKSLDIEEFKQKLLSEVPAEYREKIKIIVIDLRILEKN